MAHTNLSDFDNTYDPKYLAINLLMVERSQNMRRRHFSEFIDAGWSNSNGRITQPVGPCEVSVSYSHSQYVLSFSIVGHDFSGSGNVIFSDYGLFDAIPFASAKDALKYVDDVEREFQELMKRDL